MFPHTLRRSRVVLAALLLTAVARSAVASPESSLHKCQQTVQKTAAKFAATKLKAVGACLTSISRDIIQQNLPTAAAAAVNCAVKLAKVPPAEQKMMDKITTACDPADAAHTLADIRGVGAGVSEPIANRTIDVYCATIGGDGSLDTMGEWLDCIKAASNCGADTVIAAQVPRALEWFDRVRPDMAALVPTPTAALATLDATNAAIEGRVDDDLVGIRCGHSALPASGQLTAYTADTNDGVPGAVAVPDDGTLRFGEALRFVDDGNGTVRDLNTGLMWEKKSDDGGLHDKDNTYVWSNLDLAPEETIWDWLQDVNVEGGTGLAGYADWRIPHVKELQSIADFEEFDPAVGATFDGGCVPGCTTIDCSCTTNFNYWTSTTSASSASFAWVVNFGSGAVDFNSKDSGRFVRAVRGGS
jgi:hypothetical protein